MKIVRFFSIIFLIALSGGVYSQVAINSSGAAPDGSAMLDITATGQGILIPRMTLENRPSSPATGLMIYQTDNTPGFYYYNGSGWTAIGGGSQWTSVGSDIYYTAGKVGVGIADPAEPLVMQADNGTVYDAGVNNGQEGLGANLSVRNRDVSTGSFAQLTLHTSASAGRGIVRIVAIDAEANNSHLAFVTESGNSTGERMRITNTGNIGIGTSNPGHLLDLSGGAYCDGTGDWITGSDRNYKRDINSMTNYGLKEIMAMRPVSYIHKQDTAFNRVQIGFIAQEMKEVIPEVVDGEEGQMGLAYGQLVPVLVNAIKEQNELISTLEKRIEELENR